MSAKKIPMRMCVGCREMKPKNTLIRIVKTPENEIKPDRTGKLNGRGAYICPSAACLRRVRKSHRAEQNLGCEIPDEVWAALEGELEAK